MNSYTKEEIHRELKTLFAEIFEIDGSKVNPRAKLYEDLGLDSIDAIDLIIKLQELTGKRMQPDEFKSVRTVQDVVDVLHDSLKR